MLTYIRNYMLLTAVRAVIIQFCVNLTVVPRFKLEPFTFGEAFMLCTAFVVLTHDFRLTYMADAVNSIKNIASGIATMQYNIANLTLKRLDIISNELSNLSEENMKLEDVKSPYRQAPSIEFIAKRHGVSVDAIMKQLEMGIKVEAEHTSDEKVAEKIALDHLMELPDYYTRLEKIENED